MEINHEKKRLREIKKRFAIFNTKCNCCGDYIHFKNMWLVYRWGINKTIHPYYYCHECMPTKEDVLCEIDADCFCPFGIYPVDDFTSYRKRKVPMRNFEFPSPSGNFPINEKTSEQVSQNMFICESLEQCNYKKKILKK